MDCQEDKERENGLYSTVLYNQDRYEKVYFDEYYIHNIFASNFHDRCTLYMQQHLILRTEAEFMNAQSVEVSEHNLENSET